MMVRYCNVSMFNPNGFVEAICMPIWIILIRSQDYIYVYELLWCDYNAANSKSVDD